MHALFLIWIFCSFFLGGYYLLVLFTFALSRKETVNKQADFAVSVIICGRDEAENIKRYLPKVLQQKYAAGFEVIFVNDNSIDDSAQILKSLQEQYAHLKVLYLSENEKKGKGKKGAVKFGIEHAVNEKLVFTDADCYPKSALWLQTVAYKLQACDVLLGYGPIENEKGFLNTFCNWETANVAAQYFTFTRFKLPYMAVGRNMAYTTNVYKKVGGFNKHLHIASGDDDLFVMAAQNQANINYTIHPDSFMFSEAPKRWSHWFSQKQRHLSTAYHYTGKIKSTLTGLGASQLLFYALLPFAYYGHEMITVVVLFGKIGLQYAAFFTSFKKLESNKSVWLTPIYELISLSAITLLHIKKITIGTTIKWK